MVNAGMWVNMEIRQNGKFVVFSCNVGGLSLSMTVLLFYVFYFWILWIYL